MVSKARLTRPSMGARTFVYSRSSSRSRAQLRRRAERPSPRNRGKSSSSVEMALLASGGCDGFAPGSRGRGRVPTRPGCRSRLVARIDHEQHIPFFTSCRIGGLLITRRADAPHDSTGSVCGELIPFDYFALLDPATVTGAGGCDCTTLRPQPATRTAAAPKVSVSPVRRTKIDST
jgi:hypothetical protein